MTQEISLVKGEDRFIFRYERGEESATLGAIVDAVHNQNLPFDWFDAAVLSHEIGQRLAKEIRDKQAQA